MRSKKPEAKIMEVSNFKDKEVIKKKLKDKRLSLGLLQTDISNLARVTQGSISKLENKSAIDNYLRFLIMLEGYGITKSDLVLKKVKQKGYPNEYVDKDRLISLLRNARAKKGLSQGQLAESLNIAQAKISKLESGKIHYNLDHFLRHLDVLCIEMESIKR